MSRHTAASDKLVAKIAAVNEENKNRTLFFFDGIYRITVFILSNLAAQTAGL